MRGGGGARLTLRALLTLTLTLTQTLTQTPGRRRRRRGAGRTSTRLEPSGVSFARRVAREASRRGEVGASGAASKEVQGARLRPYFARLHSSAVRCTASSSRESSLSRLGFSPWLGVG